MDNSKKQRSHIDNVMADYKKIAEESKSSLNKKKEEVSEKAIYNGKNTDVTLRQVNGTGLGFIGEFRYDLGTYATYHFLTFFFFPIIPFGCYRVKTGKYNRISRKRSTQEFTIYGTERWKLSEVLKIYIRSIAVLAIFIGVILLIEYIASLF